MISSVRRWSLRFAAIAVVTLFLAMVMRFWHPVFFLTSLIQIDASSDDWKIAAFREQPIYVHDREVGGYDGQYYAQIAYDPLLKSTELPHAIDNISYRARRILTPALSWVLAAGRPAAIAQVYSVLNIFFWLWLAAILWRILEVADLRGWLAWSGMLFSAGALGSVRLALTDLPMLTLLAAALLAAQRARPASATAWLGAAALARETALLGAAGLWAPPWFSRKNCFIGLGLLAPLLAWLIYIRWRLGQAEPGLHNITLPFAGFVEKWMSVFDATFFRESPLLAWAALFAIFGVTVQGLYFLWQWRLFADAWWRVGAAYTVLMLMLGTAVWEGYPGAAWRVLLPLTLAFNIVACRSRAALAWLVLGNLGVGMGFIMFRDVPVNNSEIFAGRTQGTATLIQIAGGWYGVERDQVSRWTWSNGRSQLDVRIWTEAPVTGHLRLELRSLEPRTVIICQSGNELWRGPVGVEKSRIAFPLHLVSGHNKLEFYTDSPATREGLNPDARNLAFALYDPQLGFSSPSPSGKP